MTDTDSSAKSSSGFSYLPEENVFKFLGLENLNSFLKSQLMMPYELVNLKRPPESMESKMYDSLCVCLDSASLPTNATENEGTAIDYVASTIQPSIAFINNEFNTRTVTRVN